MPSGKIDKPVIQDNRDGTVSIHYEPREEGLHELNIKYNSEHVQGTTELTTRHSLILKRTKSQINHNNNLLLQGRLLNSTWIR